MFALRDDRSTTPLQDGRGEEGYLLIGLLVACFLILLALSIAAPKVAKELERDKEVESEHRALEYVRAIQLYYRRNNAYPTSVEQLLGTATTGVALGGAGQVKYLRQAYKDPITHDEYRLIHMGEQQTEVKGFFGEPLPGVAPGAGIGGSGATTSAAAAAIGGSTPGVSIGGTSSGFSLGNSTAGSAQTGAGAASGTSAASAGTTGTTGTGTGTGGTSSSSSGNDATTFQGSKGAVIGVGSNGKGPGLVEWNGSDDIAKWEFLYDPRVEQMKAKVSILGGTPAQNGTGALGSGIPGTSTPGVSIGGAAGTTGASGSSTGTSTGTPATGASGGTGTSGTATPTTP